MEAPLPTCLSHPPPSAWCQYQPCIFSHLTCCRYPPKPHPKPHLEQNTGDWGGPCSAKTVVGSAGVFSQCILVPQGDDQGAFWALGPAGELEARGDDSQKEKLSGGQTRDGEKQWTGETGVYTEAATPTPRLGLSLNSALPFSFLQRGRYQWV